MARYAIDALLADENHITTEEERDEFQRLAVFLGQVATSPEAFPPQGKNATRIRGIVRRAKGPAQPQSRKNKRKERQERRQGAAKRRRQERREFTAAYNEALAKVEADMREAEEAQRALEERIAKQPKFTIKAVDGRVILTDIPAEAILREDGEPAFPTIIVPGA